MTQQSTVQDVGSLIDKLAAKLSVPASHLWTILVRQAEIVSVTQWVWVVVWLIVAALAGVGFRRLVAKLVTQRAEQAARSGYIEDTSDARAFLTVLSWAVPVVLVAIAITLAVQAIKMHLNPEYYAIQDILDAIKPSSK